MRGRPHCGVLSQRTKTHFAAKGMFAMAVAEVLSGPQPESFHRTQLRRAVIASTIGTTIEWYDFLLYSVVTGLVFAKLFFPNPTRWSACLKLSPCTWWVSSRAPLAQQSLVITAIVSAAKGP
jgi:hypothetical protein